MNSWHLLNKIFAIKRYTVKTNSIMESSHKVRVLEVEKITHDVLGIKIEKPAGILSFPGRRQKWQLMIKNGSTKNDHLLLPTCPEMITLSLL